MTEEMFETIGTNGTSVTTVASSTTETAEPETSELHDVHRSCRDCIFARYSDRVQTGCQLGKLEIFQQQGCVVSAEDEDLKFEIINGHNCQFYRSKDSKWAIQYGADGEQARREVRQRVDMLILIEGRDLNSARTLDALKKTIDSIAAQTQQPLSVYVLSNQDDVKVQRIHKLLMDHGGELAWNITQIIKRAHDGARVDVFGCADEVFPKLRGHFYTIANVGYEFPPTFIEDIDTSINDRLQRFWLLKPVEGINGLTVHAGAHTSLDGSRPGYAQDTRAESEDTTESGEMKGQAEKVLVNNILEKAEFFTKTYSHPYVTPLEEVVQCCQLA